MATDRQDGEGVGPGLGRRGAPESTALLLERARAGDQIAVDDLVSGRREEAAALAAKNPASPSRTMLIYAGLGDKDRAYEGLVRTAEINWWRAATWLHRPEMALLRDDPRMPALKRKLRLE